MSKKYQQRRKKQAPPPRRRPWLWLVVGSAALLIIGGLSVLWASPEAGPGVAPVTGGAPKLVVDQPIIDEGPVKLDTPVRTAFRLRNVGDQPLRILDEPIVELVEGC
ncbi:MAG TPA: hypothetical protein VGD99_11380 [Anaerolineae bacterium]|jgi:hypothetical protein